MAFHAEMARFSHMIKRELSTSFTTITSFDVQVRVQTTIPTGVVVTVSSSSTATNTALSPTPSSASVQAATTPPTTAPKETTTPSSSISPATTPVVSTSSTFSPTTSSAVPLTTPSSSSTISTSIKSSSTFNSTLSTSISSSASAAAATSSNASHSSGISAGGTAGVSIATFIIGVGLALVGIWFVMARRRKHSHSSSSSHRHGERKEMMDPIPIQEETLLDPVDDSTLHGSMSKLNSFIDQHVLGHYHESPIQVPVGQLAQAITECKGVGSMGGISADELARLLIAPATRFSAIRHFIASVILSNTTLDTQPAACLLPPFIVAFHNAFPPVERQAGCDETFSAAFTKWKHLSSFLLTPNRSLREDPKLNESQIRAAIDTNLKILNHVLAPFMLSPGSKNLEWEKNLRAIIFSGAELGFVLFSQQSTWIYDWMGKGRNGSGRGIVVFPALLEKVAGTRLRIVCEAVVA